MAVIFSNLMVVRSMHGLEPLLTSSVPKIWKKSMYGYVAMFECDNNCYFIAKAKPYVNKIKMKVSVISKLFAMTQRVI